MSTEKEADSGRGIEVYAASADRHSPIVITVRPDTRHGRYRAYVGTERELLCVSRQPFLDGARKLVARGLDPKTMLVMRWAGAKDCAPRGPLGVAAKLTVDEHNGAFAKWKPLSRSAVAPKSAKSTDSPSHDRRADGAALDSTAERTGEPRADRASKTVNRSQGNMSRAVAPPRSAPYAAAALPLRRAPQERRRARE
jgi:hypothetical protein